MAGGTLYKYLYVFLLGDFLTRGQCSDHTTEFPQGTSSIRAVLPLDDEAQTTSILSVTSEHWQKQKHTFESMYTAQPPFMIDFMQNKMVDVASPTPHDRLGKTRPALELAEQKYL